MIDLKKIEHNSREIVKQCQESDIKVIGVTKGCLGDPRVAQAMSNGGVSGIADSRILNLRRLRKDGFDNLMMLRQPMCEEMEEAVRCSEVGLISDMEAAPLLSKEAAKSKKAYRVILMVEMGDLREGILPENLLKVADKILRLEHIKLFGIGTNVCPLPLRDGRQNYFQKKAADCTQLCSMPTGKDLLLLVELAKSIREKFGIEVEVISGGSSSVWKLVETKTVPEGINQLRIGEGILLGQETTSFEQIRGTYQDAFVLTAEVLEVREKKHLKGWLKQAVIALGKQDVGSEVLKPCFDGEILRVSADHMVIDISNIGEPVSLGDTLSFIPTYYALQMAMISPFVSKEYVEHLPVNER